MGRTVGKENERIEREREAIKREETQRDKESKGLGNDEILF